MTAFSPLVAQVRPALRLAQSGPRAGRNGTARTFVGVSPVSCAARTLLRYQVKPLANRYYTKIQRRIFSPLSLFVKFTLLHAFRCEISDLAVNFYPELIFFYES